MCADHAPYVSMATGGPLSVGRELAQLYNLEGVKEVNVRKVDKDEVGIDLLELKFKVQNLTITYVPFLIVSFY